MGKLDVKEENFDEKKNLLTRRISVLRSHTFNTSTDVVEDQMNSSDPLTSQSTPQLNSDRTIISPHQHNSTTNLHLDDKNEVIILINEETTRKKSFFLRSFSFSSLLFVFLLFLLFLDRSIDRFIAKITNRSEKINISLLLSFDIKSKTDSHVWSKIIFIFLNTNSSFKFKSLCYSTTSFSTSKWVSTTTGFSSRSSFFVLLRSSSEVFLRNQFAFI